MRSSWKLRRLARSLLILCGALALSLLLHVPHDAEHWSGDLVVSWLSPRLKAQHPQIVLVFVSDLTLAAFPYVTPIDRGLLADLITTIDRAGAKVIGLDVILDRRSEALKDQKLRDTLRNTKSKVVLGAVDADEDPSRIQAEYFLGAGSGKVPDAGLVYLGVRHSSLIVGDNVVRTMAEPLDNETRSMTISFAAAIAHAAGSDFKPASSIISWLLKPKDKADTFLTLSAEDVLGRGMTRLPIDKLLNGKIVLVGGNFDWQDQHLTPLSVGGDDFYSGMFIHAQILAQLMSGREIFEWSIPLQVLVGFGAGLIGFFLGLRSGHHHIWLELMIVIVLVGWAVLAFDAFHLIVPFNFALIACLSGAAVGHYGGDEHLPQTSSPGRPI